MRQLKVAIYGGDGGIQQGNLVKGERLTLVVSVNVDLFGHAYRYSREITLRFEGKELVVDIEPQHRVETFP